MDRVSLSGGWITNIKKCFRGSGLALEKCEHRLDGPHRLFRMFGDVVMVNTEPVSLLGERQPVRQQLSSVDRSQIERVENSLSHWCCLLCCQQQPQRRR
jgi:hypothetical protein